MRRRYDRCSWERRSSRSNWFIIFFLLIAIFFFNYFGKKLGGERFARLPLDIVVIDRAGKERLLTPQKGAYTVVVFVASGCTPCSMQLKELLRLDLPWAVPVVVYVDGKIESNVKLDRVYALNPKEIPKVVEFFGIKRVPVILIVDGKGLIRRRIEGFVDEKTLVAYLKAIKRYGI